MLKIYKQKLDILLQCLNYNLEEYQPMQKCLLERNQKEECPYNKQKWIL